MTPRHRARRVAGRDGGDWSWHAALLVAVTLAGACRDARPPRVEVGAPAPVYAAATLAGDSVSTADLRGRVVLLNIWATWCAPCRAEIPYLQSLYARHRDAGLDVVGVSVDARGQDADVRGYAADVGMTYPIWRDPDERIQSLYLALGVPSSYLIDRRGILRWRRLGIMSEGDTTFAAALRDALAAP